MRSLKTLERVLSKAGLGSRAQARSWIGQGRVRVNGRLVQTPDHWVDLDRDRVVLDGEPVRATAPVYLLLYKPKGYLTTRKDPQGRPTVYDLLKGEYPWVVPVGRLDLDSSGLLLLTNDTQFAERLTNPDHKIPKTYLVKTATRLTEEHLDALRRGVALKDGPTRPAAVQRLRDSGKHTFFEIAITEGRNRQVRRMVEAVGSKVLKLVRTAIGGIQISGLGMGRFRELTAPELRSLGPAGSRKPPTRTAKLSRNSR
jgi:pseudouridine synthase